MTIGLHRWGDAGPPVVFLHGWTMAGAVWADVAGHLGARSYAPDLPVHGTTTAYAPDLDGGAALLADLLRQEGLTDVTLVGWSLGALIGWHYLAGGGTGIARMVSIDMSPRPGSAPDWPCAMRGQSPGSRTQSAQRFTADWPGAARAIARAMFAPNAPPSLIEAAETRVADNDPAEMAAWWQALIRADLRPAIATLPVPLLAIHGARSRVYPPDTADWLARAAPEGRALILPGAGHSPLLETPGALAQAITPFLP